MTLPAIATGFVRKLYRILDQESGAVISWTRGGAAFAIFDDERLNEQILPRYFRGRLCAFRQQLREHGFQQLVDTSGSEGMAVAVPIAPVASAREQAQQHATYFHEHFVRGAPGRLSQITRTPLPRRRISSRKSKATKRGAAAAAAPALVVASSHADPAVDSDATTITAGAAKRARVDTASTSTASTLSSSSSFSGSGSSSASSTASAISIMKNCSSKVQPLPQQQQQQTQEQQPQSVKRNPLFSNESDAFFGDWLSLDEISLTGASSTTCAALTAASSNTACDGSTGVTTDISFSEDMLGQLMTIMSSSMTAAAPAMAAKPTTSCAAQCSGLSSSSILSSRGAVPAKSTSGAVYETHQFSEDTINLMMHWLGNSGST